jgi:hypothetical protein
MTPLPFRERCDRAGEWVIIVPLMWLGGMSWKQAIKRFHFWVWYDA